MNWAEILADPAKFPDDANININGTAVTLGTIRQQNAESQGRLQQQLQQRETELTQRQTQLDNGVNKLATIVTNISTKTGLSVDQIVSGEIPDNLRATAVRAAGETIDPGTGKPVREDPLYAPIFKEFEPLIRDMGLAKTGLAAVLTQYKEDRPRLEWLDFTVNEKPADAKLNLKYEDAVQQAVQKGYTDKVGFPDVRRVARESLGTVQAESAKTAEYERGLKAGREQAQKDQLAQLGRGSTGIAGAEFSSKPAAPEGKQGQVVKITEQLNKAFSDPTILSGFLQ